MQTIPTIILIIAIIIFIGSLIISHHATVKLGKAEGLIVGVSKVMETIVTNGISTLHEGEKKGDKAVVPEGTDKQKDSKKSSRLDNMESAEYSGVLHIFVRNKKKHERPVMTYMYNGQKIFFEYDENGKPTSINGKSKQSVLKALEGEKVKNFKKYEIKK